MTKKQTLSQLKANHLCLLCEFKSLQAFTSLSFSGCVISRQSHSNMWFCAFLPAFCHLFSLICWDRLLTVAQPGISHYG